MLGRRIYYILLHALVILSATVAGREQAAVVEGRRLLFVGPESARSWHDAREYCMNRSLDLVVIKNKAENYQIFMEIKAFFPEITDWFQWWIGITDEAKEKDWRDVCYRKVNYTHWDPTDDGEGAEPNNAQGGEHCAHLYSRNGRRWNDQPCKMRMPFICAENLQCDSLNSRQTVTIPLRLLLVNRPRTWPGARQYCQDQGLDLALFRDRYDHVKTVEYIRRFFPHSDSWFMGITLDQKSKKYVDVCNNKFNYLPWEQEKSGLIDDDRGCVSLHDDGVSQFREPNLKTVSCKKTASFICREPEERCSPLIIPTSITAEIPTTKSSVTSIPTVGLTTPDHSTKSSTLTTSSTTAKPPSISPTTIKSTPTIRSSPTTGKPPTSFRTVVTKPSTNVPITTNSSIVTSTKVKPPTRFLTTARPTTALPTTAGLSSTSRTTVKPSTSLPLTVKLSTSLPSTTKPTTSLPSTTKPTTKLPITSEPPTVSSVNSSEKTTPEIPATTPPSTIAMPTPTPTLLTESTLQSTVTTLSTNSVLTCSAREAGVCYDEYVDCAGLGPRVCGGLLTWAAEYCREYCGLCEECEDLKSCGQYGDTICSAAALSPWVDVYCRKFCNRC